MRRLESSLQQAIDDYLDEWTGDFEGGTTDEAGHDERLGWYYENSTGEIEEAALLKALASMKADGITTDADSSKDAILEAAGIEWGWKSYNYNPDTDEEEPDESEGC